MSGVGEWKWTKYTVTHTQMQAAALTNNIELLSLAASEVIEAIVIKHSTAFAGTGITAYSFEVGITGTLDKYLPSFDVFQAVSNSAHDIAMTMGLESTSGATSIKIAATSVGANLDQSTAGSVDVWVKKAALP